MHLQCVCSAQDLLLEHCVFCIMCTDSADFMQLVDSTFTVHMQHTGFTTGTLCIVFSILCMDSQDFMQLVDSMYAVH